MLKSMNFDLIETKVSKLHKKSQFILLSIILIVLLLISSCASAPIETDQLPTPSWITNLEIAYPEREWLRAVVNGEDIRTVENEAISRVGRLLRLDLHAVSSENRQLIEMVNSSRERILFDFRNNEEYIQWISDTSAPDGLAGLQVETWTNPRNGRVHAIARMNRAECSTLYLNMISENERIINRFLGEVERNPQTFEAIRLMNMAINFAIVTDNYHSILTSLRAVETRRLSYGSAGQLRVDSQYIMRSILIDVNVRGDIDTRLLTAFTNSLNSRGFRPSDFGNAPYTLFATFIMEDAGVEGSLRIIRYVLDYSMRDARGVEIFSNIETGRESHPNIAEARNRAISAAESSIASTGFLAVFEAYLARL